MLGGGSGTGVGEGDAVGVDCSRVPGREGRTGSCATKAKEEIKVTSANGCKRRTDRVPSVTGFGDLRWRVKQYAV
jgi:hypothetical protein